MSWTVEKEVYQLSQTPLLLPLLLLWEQLPPQTEMQKSYLHHHYLLLLLCFPHRS